MKNRPYLALLIIVIVLSSLVIVLRRTAPAPQNAIELDGLKFISSIDSIDLGPPLWIDDFNDSSWKSSASNSTISTRLTDDHSLNLTVHFPSIPDVQAVSVFRAINVSLDGEPLMIANVSASQGIHYGIRFSGIDPTGGTFQAWSEGSPLQHRLGLGKNETLMANLILESYSATNTLPRPGSVINKVSFYIEATPGQTGWFSLVVSQLSADPLELTPASSVAAPITGNYLGLLVNLSQNFSVAYPSDQSLFEIYVGYYLKGTADLQYNLYFNQGLQENAEGFSYIAPSPITQFQFATLLPQLVKDFPVFAPASNSSSVILVAQKGQIGSFKLSSLAFRFMSQSIFPASDVDQNTAQLLFVYYMVFLFVTPTVMVVLLSRGFHEDEPGKN